MIAMPEKITLHGMTPDEFRKLLEEIMEDKFEEMYLELQKAMGDDDLISTGTVARLLGICNKNVKVLVDRREISFYDHIKERRYNRAEILEYRDRHKTRRKRG
jgi:hypothetical protein